tara:strand:- start:1557 stop:2477 length:921 start_codon:yes stop_codon:yes gene_type:complete
MKILVMGGTRFVGKSLVEKLLKQKHEIDIFTRGNKPNPKGTKLIKGDRKSIEDIFKLKNNKYNLVFDVSGRELEDTKILIENINNSFERYVYVSSAGVYKENNELPLIESDEIDIQSRHRGKFQTENWLLEKNIPFTSFRPTYIYGPQNYNKIENWFFERIINLKKVPIPGDGSLITQLGHVSDLTDVMIKCVNYEKANKNIYNISGEKGITIKGLILKCAEACNIDQGQLELIEFDYKNLDTRSRKSFPIRLDHYLTSISKVKNDLDWEPKFDLLSGLKNSYENDFKFKLNDEFDKTLDDALYKY